MTLKVIDLVMMSEYLSVQKSSYKKIENQTWKQTIRKLMIMRNYVEEWYVMLMDPES